ncbi:hypothetical protein [Aquisphaera giovannonii]|uniref:hypothetical protein n=1 Tax=Aquisphaera giovannonii TaxID=406548 RepID=UPI0011DF055C|nr:hypothetical protein [Aquisphaera giovannonii]
MAKEPPILTLQPGGTAAARIVDASGRAVEGDAARINIVSTPGHGMDYYGRSLNGKERGGLMADEDLYANVDRTNYWDGPRSDRNGRITMSRLIPGATYRVYELSETLEGPPLYRWRDFTVQPGGVTDLGEIRSGRKPAG